MVKGETPALTHTDAAGTARMVDVSEKEITLREAEARGTVSMNPETLQLIRENTAQKGDVLGVARVAGIMAAKRTSELIPLCHPLFLTDIAVEFTLDEARHCIDIVAIVRTDSKTGVEMEALTAVSVAALTVFDMCKSVDRAMRIGDIRVALKTGGKSGEYRES